MNISFQLILYVSIIKKVKIKSRNTHTEDFDRTTLPFIFRIYLGIEKKQDRDAGANDKWD